MKPTIENQHQENKESLSSLSFYSDELQIMQRRLEEVSARNTQREIQPEIEHFQNQFLIQAKNISDLQRDLESQEKHLQSNAVRNRSKIAKLLFGPHTTGLKLFGSFEKNFLDLRKEYNRFLSRHF